MTLFYTLLKFYVLTTSIRFPRHNGTGGIWTSVASRLPQGWFHYNNEVVSINAKRKDLAIQTKMNKKYMIKYDFLINTMPLDNLLYMENSNLSKLTDKVDLNT